VTFPACLVGITVLALNHANEQNQSPVDHGA